MRPRRGFQEVIRHIKSRALEKNMENLEENVDITY